MDTLADGEELEYDRTAYHTLHRLAVEWPCLSFDILPDLLGAPRPRGLAPRQQQQQPWRLADWLAAMQPAAALLLRGGLETYYMYCIQYIYTCSPRSLELYL